MAERGKWEWNLHTIVQIVGLAILFSTGVGAWRDLQNGQNHLEEWREEHERSVQTLIAQEAAALAALTARADNAVTAIRDLSGQVDRNGYRVAALEAKSPVVDETLKELQRTLADQSGDLKVIREILQRIEKGQRGPPN
jgi:hypothetical protein